jgi:hypothetical protein
MALTNHIEHATCAIADTYRGLSKLPHDVLDLFGLNSITGRRLLNNLCSFDGCHFLEVGAYVGTTAIAASYGNKGRFVTIDNFSQFGGREKCQENLAKYADLAPVELLDAAWWNVPFDYLSPIDVFFYDGSHTADSTRLAIEHFAPAMADECIMVVDDWNWPEVRAGVRNALPRRPWHPLAQWEFFTADIPTRKDDTWHCEDPVWWNGYFIGVYSSRHCGPVAPLTCGFPPFYG